MADSTTGFEAVLDVTGFTADEITVKTDERFVVIMGEHEEYLSDQGYVARHFIRRYLLPDNIDAAALESKIDKDNHLMVTAPAKPSNGQLEKDTSSKPSIE